MVKKSTLDKFTRLGGYEIVKKKKGKWKNISEASKRTGISRPIIYQILKEHPEKPKKTKPIYVDQFENTEGYRRLKMLYEKSISASSYDRTVKDTLEAWKLLNKKDPISWDEEDFLKIWNHEKFIDKEAKGFSFARSVSFHRLMRAIKRHDLLDKFKGKKKPPGKKKEWWLHDEEIILEINAMETIPCLVYFFTGIVSGARSSGLIGQKKQGIMGLTPNMINFEDHRFQVYETKTQQYVSKYPPVCVFPILKRYIKDFNIKPDEPLFPREYDHYYTQLKRAGKKAGLNRNVSTHIMKHTFVSQGHRHGLSRETVVEATGTEDRTIKAFYLSVEEKKIRAEMQGIKYDLVPFWEWAENIATYVEGRYNELKSQGKETHGKSKN